MRSIIVMAMFTASLAGAASNDYEERRDLNLSASGIDLLDIEAGSGRLEISGRSGSDEISLTAMIQVPGRSDYKARKRIESDLVLTLEKRGTTGVLRAYFDQELFQFGASPRVHLVVYMPDSLNLAVDDGSGSMSISDVSGSIDIEDGSGSITMTHVGGEIVIDDGSGSISAEHVGGDISIEDGSGGITIRDVAGNVVIDDGSGSIKVRDVEQDLIFIDDSSGGLRFSDINGRVEKFSQSDFRSMESLAGPMPDGALWQGFRAAPRALHD